MLSIVRKDEVGGWLTTAPGVGPLVAITFKTAVDDPTRIKKSKAVGALFGLTPGKYQSGETHVTGEITRVGDEMARTALYEAANTLLSRVTRFPALKRWGMDIVKRRGMKRAKVALARKLGVCDLAPHVGRRKKLPLDEEGKQRRGCCLRLIEENRKFGAG